MNGFAHQIENAFVRSAVSRIVGALVHGSSPLGTLLMSVVIIGVVYLIKRGRRSPRRAGQTLREKPNSYNDRP